MVCTGFLLLVLRCFFFTVCQVVFDGSSNVASQLKGFELGQLSAGGTQPFYDVESLDEMAISGQFVISCHLVA